MLTTANNDRRCGRCGRTRRIEDFNRSSKLGYQFYCRDCQKQWYLDNRTEHNANVNSNTARYRERNRQLIREYLLSHPCVDCGESDPDVLEFDHVRAKVSTVSRLKMSASPAPIIAEIERCQVRCVNCHMKRTGSQLGWRKSREVTHEMRADERLFQVRS